jgi:hypothetical protein
MNRFCMLVYGAGGGKAGPLPYELAAEVAPSHADALPMRRVQEAKRREVRRITNPLLEMRRQEGNDGRTESNDADQVCHDI